jgi:hypothetical protein
MAEWRLPFKAYLETTVRGAPDDTLIDGALSFYTDQARDWLN